MTNEQLCIQKMTERTILAGAIDSARGSLPDDAPRSSYSRHKAGPSGSFFAAALCAECFMHPVPSHWVEVSDEFLALLPFLEILKSLDEQIALLKGITE